MKTQFIYRKECLKTTWRLRLAIIASCVLLVSLTRGFWIVETGRCLVCREGFSRADAILVDNLEQNYLLFERAAELQKAGAGPKVVVPTVTTSDPEQPSLITSGIAELMAKVAWLHEWHSIPIQEIEPISLNAAYQIRDALTGEHIRSVILVTPGFRSRRSSLIYQSVLGRAGITVSCVPVFGTRTPETWAGSWHGIQEVSEQFLKLQYYRFYVLPMKNRNKAAQGPLREANDQIR